MPQPRTSLLLNKGRGLVLHKGCAFGVLSPDWCTASGGGTRIARGRQSQRQRRSHRSWFPQGETPNAQVPTERRDLARATALEARSTIAFPFKYEGESFVEAALWPYLAV